MNAKLVRGFVASLIATLALFLGSTQAQVQVASDRLTVVEFKIDQIGGADGTGCGGPTIAKNHYTMIDDVKVLDPVIWAQLPQSLRDQIPTGREIELLDAGIAGPWYRTGNNFEAWKLGTVGTVAMHRIQAVQYCSHLWITEVDQIAGENAIAWLVRQRDSTGNPIYKDDGASFGVKIPINGYPITGTRMVYRAYNGAFFKRQSAVPVAYLENDPNWRFIFNWVRWEETQLLPGWELSRIDADASADPNAGKFLIPAEAKSLWVSNDNPHDSVYDPVLQQRFGSYISSTDVSSGEVRHFWTQFTQRRSEFDQSRETAYVPAGSFATMQAKVVVTPVATDPLNRIAAVPYERNGKVVHLGGGFTGSRKLWLFDPKTNVSDFTFFGQDLPEGEGNLQILIAGDTLFRMTGRDVVAQQFTASRVRVYSLLTGAETAQYDVLVKTGQESSGPAYRPELSFSPEENKLYFVAPEQGKLYWLDLTSRLYGEIPIPQGNGMTYHASDVEVDSAKRVLYVSVTGNRNAPVLGRGKVMEFPFGTSVMSRSVEVGKGPWQIAVAAVAGVNMIFVTNSADDIAVEGSLDTISQVETTNFTEVRKFVTLNQPTGIVVQLK